MKRFEMLAIRLFAPALFWALIISANQIAFSQIVCQPSGAPIVQTGSITTGDATQNGRTNRNGITGSCPTGKTNTLFASTVLHQDNYTFVNPTGQNACVTVDFDASGCVGNTTQMVAYSTFDPANPGNNIISDFGFSTIANASFGFPIAAGGSYTLVVHEITANTGCPSYQFTVRYRTDCRQPGYDRSNDGKADPTYFTPATGTWNVLNSAGGTNALNFGLAGDVLTAGDYTGDGQTDVSTYRAATNTWFYSTSQSSPQTNVTYVPYGTTGDMVTPGDYDGDGKSDIAIWRPSTGIWYVLRSSDSTAQYGYWGRNGDIPVTADFDGDLKTDFAVVRPDQAGVAPGYTWFVLQSNFDFGFAYFAFWGTAGDKVVPADYDGNGKADIAVFRPSDGTWYTLLSAAQNAAPSTPMNFRWGATGDVPQPADYDGDMRADFAIFRPSSGVWYLSKSNNGTYGAFDAPSWGTLLDTPASAPYPIRP